MIDFQKNKIFITALALAFVLGGAIYVTKSPKEKLQENSPCSIFYFEAPQNIGKYCKVQGKVDHVYISKKGNVFLNFCKNYKSCPFAGVIFKQKAPKDPKKYEGKIVEIEGRIQTYKGRPEIIIENENQIKIIE